MYLLCCSLVIFAFNDIYCYSSNRHPRLTNSQDEVIPARYKIKASKPHDDPTIAENIHFDNFPEVEYPSSLLDSTKPFYLNVSPFSNDVKQSFNALASSKTTKTNPTYIFNIKSDTKTKEHNTTETDKSRNTVADENINGKQNESRSDDNNTKTISKESADKSAFILTQEELTDSEETMEYVLEYIEVLDDFITTLTTLETELNNSTATMDEHNHSSESGLNANITSASQEIITESGKFTNLSQIVSAEDKSIECPLIDIPTTAEDVTHAPNHDLGTPRNDSDHIIYGDLDDTEVDLNYNTTPSTLIDYTDCDEAH